MHIDPWYIAGAMLFMTTVGSVVFFVRRNDTAPTAKPAAPVAPGGPLGVDALTKYTEAINAATAAVEALRATLGDKPTP